jgi:hypothetical protein
MEIAEGAIETGTLSDPLPPAAALPLCKGENLTCPPLVKEDSREAAGGREQESRLPIRNPHFSRRLCDLPEDVTGEFFFVGPYRDVVQR